MADALEEIALGGHEPVDYTTPAEEPDATQEVFDDEPPPPRKRRRAKQEQRVEYEDSEEIARHQSLLMQLTRFGLSDRFGPYLKSLSFVLTASHLRSQEIEELEETLQRCKCACMNRGSTDFFSNAVLAVAQGAEIALCKSSIPIEAHGFAEMLKKDQQFMDILHLLELSSNLTYGSPYVLLAYSLMGSLSKTHSINKFLKARAQFAVAQQKLETEGKSADKANDDDDNTDEQ